MNIQNIEIKEKRNGFLLKGFIYLALTVISLFVALMPYIFASLFDEKTVCFLVGGAAFVIFTIVFVLHIYSEINPRNVLLINEKGFKDILNVGEYEIEWTNVSSVKLIGKANAQYLGISLENSDLIIENIKPKYADAMRSNLEDNLPAIIIDANNIKFSLSELKDIFTTCVKDARKLSDDFNNRTKSNPFTTEDVLRAFGKIPTDVKQGADIISDVINVPENVDTAERNNVAAVDKDDFYMALNDITFTENEPKCDESAPTEISATEDGTEDIVTESNESDALAATKIFISLDTESTAEVVSDDEVTDEDDSNEVSSNAPTDTEYNTEYDTTPDPTANEIDDILSRVKSSKISELEKILSDEDVPFILSRIDKIENENPEKRNETNDQINRELDFDVSSNVKKNEQFDNDDFNISLDELIQNALNPTTNVPKKEKVTLDSHNNDYPELINLNDDTNSFNDIVIPKFD